MRRFLHGHAKSIALICGFLFAAVGAVWSLLVVDRLNDEMQRLSDASSGLSREIDSLNGIASEYFIANQQGDLIFILAQQGNARQDVAGLIYEGNILDRATPVRNMIGALALAGVFDYRQTYDAYAQLNDQTRAEPTFANFVALKQAEQAIIAQGQERVPLLLEQRFEMEKAINANAVAQQRARVIGVVASIIGSFLLLAANLIAEREGKGEGVAEVEDRASIANNDE
ncbi:MAG: hypothetical protein J5I90_02230 [Caldilineales bacterium]|nr:hypothetical protein [Caldilineales bacterium]